MNATIIEPPVQLISVKDAASRLAISPRGVWRLLSTGELRAVRIGRRVLFPVDSIRSFIEQRLRAN
jgi:excisionase family DNA binding protein